MKNFLHLIGAVVLFAFSGTLLAQCPSIDCPPSKTVNTDKGKCYATVTYAMPSAIDTCSPNIIYTFTNCSATGGMGPTQSMVNAAYNGTTLDGKVIVNASSQGIQLWRAPASGIYTIEALGAKGGGTNGGLGAQMIGEFNLTSGQLLKILVGQEGTELLSARYDWSGGGGTFVTDSVNNPLVVAGGGGGGYISGASSNGWVNQNGQNGAGGHSNGFGGSSGTGGTYVNQTSDGGAGILGNGGSGNPNPAPQAFINGGQGGCNAWGSGGPCANGGFGGGGGTNRNSTSWWACGGGGGYSGGGAAYGSPTNYPYAGGGGSINNGTNQSNAAGVNAGHGSVIITLKGSPVAITQTAGLPSGSQFPIGTTVCSFEGFSAPNTDTCSFTITVVDTTPQTFIQAFKPNIICNISDPVEVPAGFPAGGTYSGMGVSGTTFDPGISGPGTFWVVYTDTVGCDSPDSTMITVNDCTGLREFSSTDIQVMPNPSTGIFHITDKTGSTLGEIVVYNTMGEVVHQSSPGSDKGSVDLTTSPKGVYIMHISGTGISSMYRLVKH